MNGNHLILRRISLKTDCYFMMDMIMKCQWLTGSGVSFWAMVRYKEWLYVATHRCCCPPGKRIRAWHAYGAIALVEERTCRENSITCTWNMDGSLPWETARKAGCRWWWILSGKAWYLSMIQLRYYGVNSSLEWTIVLTVRLVCGSACPE